MCVSMHLSDRMFCVYVFLCVLCLFWLSPHSLENSKIGDQGAEAVAAVLVSLSHLEILKYASLSVTLLVTCYQASVTCSCAYCYEFNCSARLSQR